MPYKIQYTPEDCRRYPQKKKRPQVKWGRWIPFVLLLAAVLGIRLYGIPDFLIPGDPEVTKAAAAMLIDELHAGAAVDDAVTVFCKEVFNGAGF